MLLAVERSGSIVRSSIPAFRAEDPGPNPGRSTNLAFHNKGLFWHYFKQKICRNNGSRL